MKFIALFFKNSWIQMILFFSLCILGTMFLITNFSSILTNFIDIRKKEFWGTLGILIPIMFLIPTFFNLFFMMKMIQLSDNAQKIQQLLEKQIEIQKK